MAQKPKSSRFTYIILRYMRRPIMILIAVYATSMIGWILIPGIDTDGNPRNLSFFHAFYFLTYTVTTTGFGELPYAFTEAQRMWGIVSLYAGVIAWFYALGSIVGLVQNTEFQQANAEHRFTREVSRISEPFCIICGFGNTGALLTRGMSEVGMTVVVIDKNAERIKTVTLRDYRSTVSGLCADARVPEHLIEAGLLKSNCRAVVALTHDEDINQKIAVTARLLNPDVWAITQLTSKVHEETLATLGANIHIIDPFQTYAKYLGAVIHNPAIHTLNQWLAGTPGATLDMRVVMPRKTWILCGFGRMGHWVRDSLSSENISTVVIEPHPGEEDREIPGLIVGRANQENLMKAGVADAAGIVAGTDNDSDNLSILLNARAVNPDIFFLVRQNRYRNELVFQAAKADFIMMPSLVSARRILFLLQAPLLKPFFEDLRERDDGTPKSILNMVIEELADTVGGSQPKLWTIDTNNATASALMRIVEEGGDVAVGDILRDPVDRDRKLACVALVLRSGENLNIMPAHTTKIRMGDQILFCGTAGSHHLVDATLNNEYTLAYLISGIDPPRGYVMQWFERWRASRELPA